MFRLLTILSFSFLFCIDANAQNKTLPDALFSTDGKYALIKSYIFTPRQCTNDSIMYEWALFFYDSDKEQALFAVKNDSIYMLSFEDKYESQPYYISEVGCETNAHIINSYKLGEFLNRYKFFIQPKNYTKDLVIKCDTLKVEHYKVPTSIDNHLADEKDYTISVSIYYYNNLLKNDTIKTNLGAVNWRKSFSSDSVSDRPNFVIINNDYWRGDYNTILYSDSLSKTYWASIVVKPTYVETRKDNVTDETVKLIRTQNFSSIKFGKLN